MGTFGEEAYRHVERLSVEIGPRLMGTPDDHAAQAYITGQFDQAGLQIERQEFACPDWIALATRLELHSEPLEAYANTFSPGCDLAAPTIAACTLAELEALDICGKLLIFYGELAQHELAAQAAIYMPERDRRIVQILQECKPAGLITVNPALHACWRLVEDFDLALPSATVTAGAGLKLLQALGETVHMQIDTWRKESFSANIIARKPGRDPEKIVLCAHFDTKEGTPGAYDNAAGVACLLTLANHLSRLELTPALEFVAFSGEEGYGLGDMTYARRIGDDFSDILAAINIDGVGPRLASNTLAVFSAPPALEEMVGKILAKYPGVAKVDPWPASDHYIFYSHGVPSLALTSSGIRDIYHTPFDTIEWISPEKLGEAVSLVLELVHALDRM